MLQAAAQLFAERGYVGTTVADVARRAGVSEPNVYAVFTSKPGLLAAAIRQAVRSG
jgi:TetR/AcrR family transcriptional regulator, regulator of cefoperazone and chloramphenicol sensitivity